MLHLFIKEIHVYISYGLVRFFFDSYCGSDRRGDFVNRLSISRRQNARSAVSVGKKSAVESPTGGTAVVVSSSFSLASSAAACVARSSKQRSKFGRQAASSPGRPSCRFQVVAKCLQVEDTCKSKQSRRRGGARCLTSLVFVRTRERERKPVGLITSPMRPAAKEKKRLEERKDVARVRILALRSVRGRRRCHAFTNERIERGDIDSVRASRSLLLC